MIPTRPIFVALLLVASAAVPVGTVAATPQQSEGYAGTHVEFETTADALVDYSVDGETVLESVTVQSQSEAESQGDMSADVGLSAVTELSGTGLSLASQTTVNATVNAESGATMEAHDNSQGILLVRSGDDSQYVTVNVSSSSSAESEDGQRVSVTTDDGTEGTFIVVGDGEVTVNEQGNVSADLKSDSTLVFRSYPEGRDDDDQQEERSISDGRAAAEVHVMAAGEQGSELAADVVQYSEDTAVEVTQKSEGTVRMTAERSQEEGRIIITSVSEQAISSAEDLQVMVDGEAAAEASAYSELESAIGGDASRYMVRQQSSAEASADVLVAVNSFSQREITMTEGSDGDNGSDGNDGSDGSASGDDDDSDQQTSTSGDGSGFGLVAVILALSALTGVLAHRRR